MSAAAEIPSPMPLAEACRELGMPIGTALNRVQAEIKRRGRPEFLGAVKVLGRWKVQRALVERTKREGWPVRTPPSLADLLHYPHFMAARGRRGR